MAILPIRRFGDPGLRQRAGEVDAISELHGRLFADMLETMRDAPGVGLAGPQVGILERVFVWEVDGEHGVVINPVIVELSEDTVEAEEGCLSLPGLTYPVVRAERATIEGLDAEGAQVRMGGEGLKARVFQHEIDHLDGILFIDRLAPEPKKEALRILADQALGLAPVTSWPPEGREAL